MTCPALGRGTEQGCRDWPPYIHADFVLLGIGARPLALPEVTDILTKEELNGYGIMAPSGPQVMSFFPVRAHACHVEHGMHGQNISFQMPAQCNGVHTLSRFLACTWGASLCPPALQGERRIRGTAIYPQASLLNHECLPNVARFDDFDSPQLHAPHNTVVRA